MKHMLLGVSAALGLSLSVAISVHAFSIGEIKVQSYLHTPFVAEVPLILKPHERDQGFVAVIGDEGDYQDEGVTRMPVIEVLRPSILMGPSDVIRIISTAPIDVPAFDLLLLVRAGQVTIVQNYPVALLPDPRSAPITAETPPAKSAPPLPLASMAPSEPPSPTAPAQAAWQANLPAQYGPILRGEMLYKVIKRLRVPKPYIWPVAVRIWEHNRNRFVRGNLHGLRIGVYLEIPEELRHAPPKRSRREAQEMVAEQWAIWQQPAQMVVASKAAKAAGIGNGADPAPVEPIAPTPAAVAFPPKVETSPPVNMATLESMLQGFEKRLTQRLSLPAPAAEAAADHAITFVSTDDLQTALQALESRLMRQFNTGQPPAEAQPAEPASSEPALRVGMETALASFLSADSWVYVLIVQNIVLLAIAAGIAWRGYRKRTDPQPATPESLTQPSSTQ
ncbi:type IV pilus assembly protein FimV [Candidatus Entotheonella palauensis]|uniref:type IV pilus assembly protein FimV n=1 Tax=Candidatus Entotheonella palauensis TaxID=93172 RepID=UPI0011780915|nr:hypothetical protein [Candidatus Entotheonella palauensis]